MNYYINNETQNIVFDDERKIPLYSVEGFRIISDLWLKIGWDQKYLYSFTWLGRPLIQIPEDALRIQEVIYAIKPDVIIETGIAHGGSLVFSASLCKLMGKGKVIGVDIEIRPHNRKAIENHELFEFITLIEGNAIGSEIFEQVKAQVQENETTLIILDSCHTYDHVLKELELYSQILSNGSYIVATDGSQEYLNETPRAKDDYPDCGDWGTNNPKKAAEDFVKNNTNYEIVEPEFLFNEGKIDFRITHWPSAFIRKKNI
jgi:cephalosporin hydroxylase